MRRQLRAAGAQDHDGPALPRVLAGDRNNRPLGSVRYDLSCETTNREATYSIYIDSYKRPMDAQISTKCSASFIKSEYKGATFCNTKYSGVGFVHIRCIPERDVGNLGV